MHDRRQRWLPAEAGASSYPPVVCIQALRPCPSASEQLGLSSIYRDRTASEQLGCRVVLYWIQCCTERSRSCPIVQHAATESVRALRAIARGGWSASGMSATGAVREARSLWENARGRPCERGARSRAPLCFRLFASLCW